MFKLFVLAALLAVAAAGVVAPIGTYSTTVKSGYYPAAYSAYAAAPYAAYPYAGAYGAYPYAAASAYSAYPYAGAYGAYPYHY